MSGDGDGDGGGGWGWGWVDENRRSRDVDKKSSTLLDLCVSSLRRGHANLLCIIPILTDDPRRESGKNHSKCNIIGFCCKIGYALVFFADL